MGEAGEQRRREGGGDHDTVSVRDDFSVFEDLFEAIVGGVCGQRRGEFAGDGDERGQGGSLSGGYFVGCGDFFDFEVQRAR